MKYEMYKNGSLNCGFTKRLDGKSKLVFSGWPGRIYCYSFNEDNDKLIAQFKIKSWK